MKRSDSSRWNSFWMEFETFRTSILRIQAVNVNKREIRESAKEIVRHYFSEERPELHGMGIETAGLDESMQDLIRLSNGVNAKRSYQKVVKSIEKEYAAVETQRAIRMGEIQASQKKKYQPTSIEAAILSTLEKLLPNAAVSYRQALDDLSDPNRLSFRGTAAELREVLREVLNHMAPDETVQAAEGFQLEKERRSPTMKQKMHFILHSRKSPKTAMKAPEDATSLVDNWRASFTRSTYERASVSTHRPAARQEVTQLKMYVDSALAEILIIPT